MVIKLLVFIGLMAGLTVNAYATSPTSVSVTYEKEKQILHVTASHPSDKLDKHYLRRISIEKNGVEDKSVTFPRQKLASGLDEEISYVAEAGEKLSIKINCSQGGVATAEVDVPQEASEEHSK